MKKRIILTRTLCALLALLLVTALLWAVGRVLGPKYVTQSPEGSLTAEYYADAAAVRHDVLFVGDCEVYEAFIPAVLWREYGISSCVRGSAQQLVWQSCAMLEDTLRYETPSVVVFNVLALKYGTPQSEAFNRMTLDGMAWSPVKAEAIRASMTDEETFITYLLPALRFHSRWNELTADDWKYAFTDKPTLSDGGYLMQTGILPPDPSVDDASLIPTLLDPALPESAMAWLDRMVSVCEERGITLILVKSPTDTWKYHWYDEWDAQVRAYAEAHGLSYFNLIPEAGAMGLDMTTDTYDGGVHLNVYGAEKLTRFFGQLLKDTADLPDRRSDAAFADVWAARLTAYDARKAAGVSRPAASG